MRGNSSQLPVVRSQEKTSRPRREGGFTILELIVVLAILTVLIGAVVFALDPLQITAKARDATRLSDLDSIVGAISFAESNAPIAEEGGYDPDGALTGSCVGESSQTVFVSVIGTDVNGTCDAGEMPNDLPTGWSYRCAPNDGPQDVDGTGWLPVDFTFVGTVNSAISNLPIDASNKFSSGFYYSYVCNSDGLFEITARMASDDKRTGGPKDVQSDDGGDDIFVYETGSDLTLNPKPPIGYWALDEGSGTTTADSAGNYGGTLVDGPTWATSGCIRGNCLLLDGLNDRVQTITSDPFEYRGEGLTTVVWHRPAATDIDTGNLFSNPWNGSGQYNHRLALTAGGAGGVGLYGDSGYFLSGLNAASKSSWHQFAMTVDSADLASIFLDGTLDKSATHSVAGWVPSAGDANRSPLIGCYYPYGSGWVGNTTFCAGGEVDEVAFYDRALSSAELKYQYDSLKP